MLSMECLPIKLKRKIMKRKAKDRKTRNPIAALLSLKLFKPKTVKSKKKYDRAKEKRKEIDDQS